MHELSIHELECREQHLQLAIAGVYTRLRYHKMKWNK